MRPEPLLSVTDLTLAFRHREGDRTAVEGVSFAIRPGETLCLVGESGCGKSVTARSLLQVVGEPGYVAGGAITWRGGEQEVDIAAMEPSDKRLRHIRGPEIAMVHQEPLTALSALYTIGDQIIETLRLHRPMPYRQARAEAIEMLRAVGMPSPEERVDSYTFQLSGGQRQRAMIALALICEPKLLIADEPTTALDVTTQAAILDLIARLARERGMALLFITHDLAVVDQIADQVAVMYLGHIVERGPAREVIDHPKHPYTQGLLASMPRLDHGFGRALKPIPGTVPPLTQRPSGCPFHPRCALAALSLCDREMPGMGGGVHAGACHALDPAREHWFSTSRLPQPPARHYHAPEPQAPRILEVSGLRRDFVTKRGLLGAPKAQLRAVDDVSLELRRGETLGLVGESGCGKSTLGRMIVGLETPEAGQVTLSAEDGPLDPVRRRERQAAQRAIRMVFQDPAGSLNPRLRVGEIVGEVLRVQRRPRAEVEARVAELLEMIGLGAEAAHRYPHAFSGGQRQRIAIARALASDPQVIIADEAVSALDVSVQSQVLNEMKALQARLGLTYLFISHDLSVVANVCDRIAVMYAGRIVETGPTRAVFTEPRHPYTRLLLDAVPGRDKREALGRDDRLRGSAPLLSGGETGCPFAPRCPLALEECRRVTPELRDTGPGQAAACLRTREAEALPVQEPAYPR